VRGYLKRRAMPELIYTLKAKHLDFFTCFVHKSKKQMAKLSELAS
jgi:hypothetical protein